MVQQAKASKASSMEQSLDESLVNKAVGALLKYNSKQGESSGKEQLFGDDAPIHVNFTLEVAPVKLVPKPIRLKIPHQIYNLSSDSSEGNSDDNADLDEPEVCLIVKDDAKPWLQEMVDRFPERMGHIKKILTLTSLRTKHSEYKKRRELAKKYSIFMADDRIVPMIHKVLGRTFYDSVNTRPIPIRITRKDALPHMIQKALSATYMILNTGNCVSVKTGFTNMSRDKLVANITALAKEAVDKIPRGWGNIRSIGIKTPSSVMLPVYNRTPEQLEEINKMAGLAPIYLDEKADKTKENNDEKEEKEEELLKQKNKDKSPLLKALQKQKKLEKQQDEQELAKADDTKSPDKEHQSADDNEVSSEQKDEKEKKKKKKKEKRRRESDATEEDQPISKEESPSPKKKTKTKDVEKSSEKKKKESKKAESMDLHEAPKGEFIASKKFTGSKKGYFFRKGVKGLGYYKDVKPVVTFKAPPNKSKKSKRRGRR